MMHTKKYLTDLLGITIGVFSMLLPAWPASAAIKPSSDEKTVRDVRRMMGTWSLVKQEPEQELANKTRADYIARGLLLEGTARQVLIKNLTELPKVDKLVIGEKTIDAGRTRYYFSPGQGKLIIERRGDRVERKFRSVYDKIGPTEMKFRFEKDGSLILETNSLKELGGKSLRYTLRKPLPPGIDFRVWTSVQGSTLEAKLVAFGDTQITLEERKGSYRQVNLRALSEVDRLYVQQMRQKAAEERDKWPRLPGSS